MYTGKDFENMGKVAAEQYVSHNKPLNDSIIKIAEHYGLNQAQIARVVEQANVETYLKVNDISNDKYAEFQIADPKVISSKLEFKVEKRAAFLNNYSDLEEKVLKYTAHSGDLPEDTERKEKAEALLVKKAERAITQEIDKKLEELDETFSRESANLYNLVKQASLQSGSFGLVKRAMLEAVPQPLTDFIAEAYKVRLVKEASGKVNFDEIEESPGILNRDNPIVKSLIKLAVLKEEYSSFKEFKKEMHKLAAAPNPVATKKISERFLSAASKIFGGTMDAGAGVLGSVGALGEKIIKHPLKSIGIAAIPVAAGLGIAKGRSQATKSNVKVNRDYVTRAKNLRPI